MLFARGVAVSPRRSRVGVMAFRNIVRVDTKHQHAILPSCSSTIRCEASRIMNTKYSIHEEEGDYNSMTVSDLRELLRQRGLAISGIKAQLVERLESGAVNPGKIGNRSNTPRSEKKKSSRKVHVHNDHDSEKEMIDELAGLVNHLKSLEAGNDASIDPKRERMQDPNCQIRPKNLVFAKDREEESDNEWGDDEDYEEEEGEDDNDDSDLEDYNSDPNTTARAPQMDRSRSGGGETVSFKEDFQGTRVFVQGLPEEATWKDVSMLFLPIVLMTSLDNSYIQSSPHLSAQRSFQAKH